MRLLKLELENWSCHSHLNLDLSNGLQIEGRNGSGKTSILEAVRFIFEESAHGYKNRIKNGERSARVTLSLDKDGSKYLVEKELFLDKPSTARMYCNDTVVGDNPSSVYKNMQNILDENILDKLLYIPQGGLTTIVESLTRKEGRKELDSLFGLEKFDRIYRESVDDIKEARLKLDFTLEQAARHPKEADKQYTEELEKLNTERKTLEEEVKAKKREAGKLDSEIRKTASEVKRLEDVKKTLDQLKEELRKLDVTHTKTTADLENIKQRLEAVSKKTDELNRLAEKEGELKKYPGIRELLARLEKLNARREGMETDRDREKLTAMEKELVSKQEVEEKHSQSEKTIKENEALKAAVEHDLKKQKDYLKELENLEGKANCPRCGQKLTEEHLNSEKTLTMETAEKLSSNLAGLAGKQAKMEGEHKQLKEKLSKLEKTEAEAKYIKAELGKKSGEEKAIRNETERLGEKLREMGYDGEELSLVEGKVEEYNKTRGELQLLKEELKQKDELQQKHGKLSETLRQLTQQKEEKDRKLGRLEYDEEGLQKLRENKEELMKKMYAMENECDKKQYRAGEINAKEGEVKKKLEEYVKLKKEEQSRGKEIKLLTQAREIFHTDKGIQKYLRDRYINQLNNLLTYYFKRINENPRYNEIIFDKNYEIQIKTTEGDMTIDQLSGGEKIQLAITLRIALTEILSHTRLLILDEPFGSLDRNHREILGETLNKIASNGQLVIVTHVHVDSLQLESIELQGY